MVNLGCLCSLYLLENTIQRLNNSDQVNAHRCEFLKRAVALCLKHYQQYNGQYKCYGDGLCVSLSLQQ